MTQAEKPTNIKEWIHKERVAMDLQTRAHIEENIQSRKVREKKYLAELTEEINKISDQEKTFFYISDAQLSKAIWGNQYYRPKYLCLCENIFFYLFDDDEGETAFCFISFHDPGSRFTSFDQTDSKDILAENFYKYVCPEIGNVNYQNIESYLEIISDVPKLYELLSSRMAQIHPEDFDQAVTEEDIIRYAKKYSLINSIIRKD